MTILLSDHDKHMQLLEGMKALTTKLGHKKNLGKKIVGDLYSLIINSSSQKTLWKKQLQLL